MKNEDSYNKVRLTEYGGHSHQPLYTKDIYFQDISKKSHAELANHYWLEMEKKHEQKQEQRQTQFAKGSDHLNQTELTRQESEALYWKLLAPLNYKILEGKYILVCPVCDADLGFSIDRMVYTRHFTMESLWGAQQRKSHDAECKAVGEVNESM